MGKAIHETHNNIFLAQTRPDIVLHVYMQAYIPGVGLYARGNEVVYKASTTTGTDWRLEALG